MIHDHRSRSGSIARGCITFVTPVDQGVTDCLSSSACFSRAQSRSFPKTVKVRESTILAAIRHDPLDDIQERYNRMHDKSYVIYLCPPYNGHHPTSIDIKSASKKDGIAIGLPLKLESLRG